MEYEEYEEYEDYEIESQKNIKKNEVYINIFIEELEKSGLKEKTIYKHEANVNFYLNNYMLREYAADMKEGLYHLGEFLGDYFIRKCMWSTPASIKTTASSLKKFYKVMSEKGFIESDDYKILCAVIKNDMEFWMEKCAIYNDPENDSFYFF